METIIELNGVNKSFGANKIYEDVNLKITKGECVDKMAEYIKFE